MTRLLKLALSGPQAIGMCRGLFVALCLGTGGCFPREAQTIGAVDPMNDIPAIQRAAQARDPKAVPALIGQLNNDDPAIRFYAIEALQRITGQTMDYRYYDDVDARRPAIERWNHWLKQRTS